MKNRGKTHNVTLGRDRLLQDVFGPILSGQDLVDKQGSEKYAAMSYEERGRMSANVQWNHHREKAVIEFLHANRVFPSSMSDELRTYQKSYLQETQRLFDEHWNELVTENLDDPTDQQQLHALLTEKRNAGQVQIAKTVTTGESAMLKISEAASFCLCNKRTIYNRLRKVNPDGTPLIADVIGTGRMTRIPRKSLEPFRRTERQHRKAQPTRAQQKSVKRGR